MMVRLTLTCVVCKSIVLYSMWYVYCYMEYIHTFSKIISWLKSAKLFLFNLNEYHICTEKIFLHNPKRIFNFVSVFSSTKNNPKGHAFATLKKKRKLKIPLKLKYHYVKTCWKQLKTVKSSIKLWNKTGLLFYLKVFGWYWFSTVYKGTRSALRQH